MPSLSCGPECRLQIALASSAAGPARQRQLRWVVGEIHALHADPAILNQLPSPTAGQHEQDDTEPPIEADDLPAATDCTDWLYDTHALAYLRAAGAGSLRARGPGAQRPGTRPSTAASVRVRASCMRELARLAPTDTNPSGRRSSNRRGQTDEPAERDGKQTREEESGQAQQERQLPAVGGRLDPVETFPATNRKLLAHLARGRSPRELRTWAVAALATLDIRIGEVAALELDDIEDDGRLLRIVRNPPGPGEPYLTQVRVPAYARKALRAWLAVREDVAANLEGSTPTHVFLTTHHTHTPTGRVYPAGLPITARGLARAHRAAVQHYLTQTNPTASLPLAITDLAPGRLELQPAKGLPR